MNFSFLLLLVNIKNYFHNFIKIEFLFNIIIILIELAKSNV